MSASENQVINNSDYLTKNFYVARYGMEFNPFIKNSKEIIYSHTDYNEARSRLDYLLNVKGFGIITGLAGLGKTTIVRNWTKSLNTNLFKVFYSPLSTLSEHDFYINLATTLGLEAKFKKSENIKMIKDEIERLSNALKTTPIFIIDEANHIKGSILSDFKILFNFEMDSKDKAVILLVGSPGINSTLRLSCHEALRQRIIMHYELTGLDKKETKEYIACKLKGAGCHHEIFEPQAIEAITNIGNGTPRMINKICNEALHVADHLKADIITADIVQKALNETSFD